MSERCACRTIHIAKMTVMFDPEGRIFSGIQRKLCEEEILLGFMTGGDIMYCTGKLGDFPILKDELNRLFNPTLVAGFGTLAALLGIGATRHTRRTVRTREQ